MRSFTEECFKLECSIFFTAALKIAKEQQEIVTAILPILKKYDGKQVSKRIANDILKATSYNVSYYSRFSYTRDLTITDSDRDSWVKRIQIELCNNLEGDGVHFRAMKPFCLEACIKRNAYLLGEGLQKNIIALQHEIETQDSTNKLWSIIESIYKLGHDLSAIKKEIPEYWKLFNELSINEISFLLSI
jgi:hypothetical protein